MYILAQTNSLENNKSTIYMVHAPELEEKYQNAGYKRHERSYKLKYQYKEYSVLCPEYRNDETGGKSIVIVPVFLIPRRPYPAYVYLYSIDLYSSNPDMGQRKAAETTKKLFGLTQFAHTTLGRALKSFVCNVEENAEISGDSCGDDLQETAKENVVQPASDAKADENKNNAKESLGFPTTQATMTWRKRAVRFLEGKISFKSLKQFIERCCELAKEWFKGCCRFLL